MEESKRLDIEFKATFIRFFKNFLGKANKFSEILEDMKKDQLEIKQSSDSKQSTEDEEQEEDEPDNKQPGDHLGHDRAHFC
ncbi:hypothetical protein QTO34_012959 [Cnephaeus nilssonii]|uniref:Uncharacterized protein n=1 Tax=Cnephaeus nilssonii TaxID=3371016 RepID=A0AA40HAG8_CNENI|nr:hypothetical protein QTO34_012959 [Eptesicus nilssonii]